MEIRRFVKIYHCQSLDSLSSHLRAKPCLNIMEDEGPPGLRGPWPTRFYLAFSITGGPNKRSPAEAGLVHDGATPDWALRLAVVDPDFLVYPAGTESPSRAAAVSLDPVGDTFHEVIEERNKRAALVV